jgi:hypothetical protein
MERPFRLTPPRLSEKHVTLSCLDLLRLRGYYPLRLPVGVFKSLDGKRYQTYGEPGLPDWIAAHSLYPAPFFEIKAPDGKLRPDQIRKIGELEQVYSLSVAVISDPAHLSAWLDRYEQRFKR